MLFGLVPEILRQALRDLPSYPRLWQQLGDPRFAFSGWPEDGPKQKMIQFRKSCFTTLDLEESQDFKISVHPSTPRFHWVFPISKNRVFQRQNDLLTEVVLRLGWESLCGGSFCAGLNNHCPQQASAGCLLKRWQLTTCCWFESIQVQFCWRLPSSKLT